MGVYVAGTTIGGLAGRLIPAFTSDLASSWRWALAVTSLAAAACTVWFVRWLPPSRGFVPRPAGIGTVLGDLGGQLRHRGLLALLGLAFVLMGGFVSMYNYLGYRLASAPFSLPEALAGLVFVLYLAGTAASAASGRLTDRIGRQWVLTISLLAMTIGLVLTIPDHLGTVILGVLLYTAGFFGAHTAASAWVGAMAEGNRGAASSLYLFAYYLGSALVGGAAGIAYARAGWLGLTCGIGFLMVLAALLLGVSHRAQREAARRAAPASEAAPVRV
jgi:predicted MFS family arabinose efflux permease